MKITLTYQGPLPPNKRGVSQAKAELRKAFHPQIEAQVRPLLSSKTLPTITTSVDGCDFVSVAHPQLRTAVDLDILLIAPRGRRPTGDTDNRLKTLVDGLTRPANPQQMQRFEPPSGGGPMYCLMDDDGLVKRLSVDSRPWFFPDVPTSDALVVVSASIVLGDNADLTSPTANIFLVL